MKKLPFSSAAAFSSLRRLCGIFDRYNVCYIAPAFRRRSGKSKLFRQKNCKIRLHKIELSRNNRIIETEISGSIHANIHGAAPVCTGTGGRNIRCISRVLHILHSFLHNPACANSFASTAYAVNITQDCGKETNCAKSSCVKPGCSARLIASESTALRK